jgi:hypothetical protein
LEIRLDTRSSIEKIRPVNSAANGTQTNRVDKVYDRNLSGLIKTDGRFEQR